MKTNLLKGLSVLFLGVVLAGCSASGSSDKSGSKKTTQEPTKIAFAKDVQSSRQYIWYAVSVDDDGLAKDSEIDSVYVSKNGKMKAYNTDVGNYDNGNKDLLLSDVDKKSDAEIIAKAKKIDEKNFDENIKEAKKEQSDPSNFADDAAFQKSKSELAKHSNYEAPTWEKVKITASTDNSGNNVSKEEFSVKGGLYVGEDTLGNLKISKNSMGEDLDKSLQNTFPILSKYYTGYSNDDNDEYFLTTVSKKNHEKASVSMDKTSTKGVSVDDDD